MHVPDGFLDLPTSLATGLAAAASVGVALRRSGTELQQAGAGRAGLTACFVFAAQMINFPVVAGTSGHLVGAGLAAALVGPWTAVLTLACVLVVQALVFADGGVTALGTNIVLLAVVPVLASALVSRGVLRVGRHRRSLVASAAGIGAFVSVPVSALAFTGLYAVGGTVRVPLGLLAATMTGTHLVIGVGEGLITASVLAAVLAVRPDLVQLWRRTAGPRTLLLVDARGRSTQVPADGIGGPPGVGDRAAPHGGDRRVPLVGLGVAALLAGGVSLFASAAPDALEATAASLGFSAAAHESVVAGSPLAGYSWAGAGPFATSLAGLAGVALTLGLTLVVAGASRRVRGRRRRSDR